MENYLKLDWSIYRKILFEAVRFGVVGLIATGLHVGVAWIVAHFSELGPFSANLVGYIVAFVWSYAGHFYWTFGRRSGHRAHLPKFLVISLSGYAISNGAIYFVVDVMQRQFEIALLCIGIIVPIASWIMNRLWAFRGPVNEG